MKHILFAREDAACKHEKTTEKSLKIWPGNPENICAAKSQIYVASHGDLAIQIGRAGRASPK